MTHDDYKEMLAFAAFGALDDASARRSLDAHLSSCAECRVELDELREVVAMLAHGLAPAHPSAALRARVLESIKSATARAHDTAPTPASGDASSRTNASTGGVAARAHADTVSDAEGASATVEGSNVLPFAQPRERRTMTIGRAAFTSGAIAASLVIAALAAALAVVWTRHNRTQAELARLSASIRATQEELSRTRQELAAARGDVELLAAVMESDKNVALAGTEAAPDAHGMVAYDPRTGRTVLLASGLPPAPDGKAYQLWFIAGTRPPMPGRAFTTDTRGRATLHDQAPREGLDAKTFVVTLEPAGGVAAPTGAKYLVGSLS